MELLGHRNMKMRCAVPTFQSVSSLIHAGAECWTWQPGRACRAEAYPSKPTGNPTGRWDSGGGWEGLGGWTHFSTKIGKKKHFLGGIWCDMIVWIGLIGELQKQFNIFLGFGTWLWPSNGPKKSPNLFGISRRWNPLMISRHWWMTKVLARRWRPDDWTMTCPKNHGESALTVTRILNERSANPGWFT